MAEKRSQKPPSPQYIIRQITAWQVWGVVGSKEYAVTGPLSSEKTAIRLVKDMEAYDRRR